jgi:hypothetical protein
MPQHFVRIVNRPGKYTNMKRADYYVRRGLARVTYMSLSRRIIEIAMLDAAELAVVRSQLTQERREKEPKYAWYVGESGGSKLMRDYEGIGGGTRLWNADCGGKPEVAPA